MNIKSLITGNAAILVGTICALAVVHSASRTIGLGGISTMALLTTASMLTTQLCMGIAEATPKLAGDWITRGHISHGFRYFTATLSLVSIFGISASVCVYVFLVVCPNVTRILPFEAAMMALSGTVSALAQVLTLPQFLSGSFHVRDISRSVAAVLQTAVVIALLSNTEVGPSAVVYGAWTNALIQAAAGAVLCQRSGLPVSVTAGRPVCSLYRRILTIAIGAIGAYAGMYLVRAGVIWCIETMNAPITTGLFAITQQISLMVATSTGAVAALAGPRIYSAAAKREFANSALVVSRHSAFTLLWTFACAALVVFHGPNIINLWLGSGTLHHIDHSVQLLLMASMISVVLTTQTSLVGTYCIATGTIGVYGAFSVLEGVIVIVLALVILAHYPDSGVYYVALLPGPVSLFKQYAMRRVLHSRGIGAPAWGIMHMGRRDLYLVVFVIGVSCVTGLLASQRGYLFACFATAVSAVPLSILGFRMRRISGDGP